MIQEVTPAEFVRDLAQDPATLLIDVREPWELEIAAIPGALHVPMATVPDRLDTIDPNRRVVVMCRSGGRSMQVARFLEAHGYPRVANLAGGILAWGRDVDPTLAAY
jgi:rhodanese-related sulfurtransferase